MVSGRVRIHRNPCPHRGNRYFYFSTLYVGIEVFPPRHLVCPSV